MTLPPQSFSQAEAYFEQGKIFAQENRFEAAINTFEQALRIFPQFTSVFNEVGNLLSRVGMHEKAIVHFHKALAIEPNRYEILHNMAYAHYRLGQFAEAISWYQRALALAPGFHHSRVGLGCALQSLGQFDAALACYQQVLDEDPQHVDALWNMFLALLLKGDYEKGWPAYEWRYHVLPEFASRRFTAPMWDGAPLNGRHILVMAEQGAGDTLQFLRYLPLVKALGGRVTFACQAPLRGLFNSIAGVDTLVTQEEIESLEYDVYVYTMTLPALFKTRLETIPPVFNPITLPDSLTAHWHAYFTAFSGLKIGITWSGNPDLQYNVYRALDPRFYETLLDPHPNSVFFSLQKEPPEHLPLPEALQSHPQFHNLAPHITNWCDTAAIVSHLDVVISVDTAVAHLAATMGKPTWLLLPYSADWRWLRNRSDSLWYPEVMRIFRQPAFADWPGAFQNLSKALKILEK